jgi:DNA-binding PadR family transcriptional regulator
MLCSVIELAVLGVLLQGERHGYELKKRLREVLGPLSSVSFGSLYPALAKLERDGMVKAVEAAGAVSAPTIPMTGSFTGEAAAFRASRRAATRGPRNKKVYGITEQGEARFAELMADPASDDKCFALKLAFCNACDRETRLGLLERRRNALVQQLADGRTSSRPERLDRYVRSLVEHTAESTERDIAWLESLIEQERATPGGPE